MTAVTASQQYAYTEYAEGVSSSFCVILLAVFYNSVGLLHYEELSCFLK